MKAMILAAGKGTRLKGLTENKPKALVEINGTPMLGLLLQKLKRQGFGQILINIHHFGAMILDYLEENNHFGLDIQISDERDKLLDTGGALVKAASFFKGDKPVLIHNVDILSDIDLHSFMTSFSKTDTMAGLLVRQRSTQRVLLFDKQMNLTGWTNLTTGQYKWVNQPQKEATPFAYSGIWIVRPGFINAIPLKGSFSIIDAWLLLAKSQSVRGFVDNTAQWYDLGTKEKIKEAQKAGER